MAINVPMGANPYANMESLLASSRQNELTQGLLGLGFGLMQAGGPSTTPVSFMGALGAGGQAGLKGYQDARMANLQNTLAAAKLRMDAQRAGQVVGSAETGFSYFNPVTGANRKLMAGAGAKPQTVEVNGEVFILNRDGTRGRSLGMSDRYVPVQGIGLFDRLTDKFISADAAPQAQSEQSQSAIPSAPVSRTGSPVVDAKITENSIKSGQAKIDKISSELSSLDKIVRGGERFEQLMQAVETGGPLRQVPGAGLTEGAFSAAAKEMQAITDSLTPAMRQGLPGAASDRDVAMFRGGLFSLDKKPETNQALILGFKAAKQNLLNKQSFFEAYLAQNNTLAGADARWNEYLQANPIFDPSVTEMRLNPNRKTWENYFKEGSAKPDFTVRKVK